MYQLISAIAKPWEGDKRWKDVAIGNVSMNELFVTYSKIIAILSNPFLTAPVSLDLDTLRRTQAGRDITFSAFLTENGQTTLNTSNTIPAINTRYAKYIDAFEAGYKVAAVHPVAAPDAQLPPAEKTWLHLTRPGTDYELFKKSCLVNVNGFYHMVDSGPDGIYIQDGMKSNFMSGKNQLGIYSFQDIGRLSLIPIKPTMIYKQNDRQKYKHRAYIDIGQDVHDKTLMLVLGGYLHVLDKKTFYRVNDSTICLVTGDLPLLDRFYESKGLIDLSSLGLETTDRNVNQIGVNDFFGDEAMLAYMTLPQSFFVVLDNPNIFVEQSAIQKTGLPGEYMTPDAPIFPMQVETGKHVTYFTRKEDGRYSLVAIDTHRPLPLYDTVNVSAQNSVSDQQFISNPVVNMDAVLLQIGSDI